MNDAGTILLSGSRRQPSRRIRTLAGLCLPGLPVLDLCCDHGLVGLVCRLQFGCDPVLLVDRASAPVQQLQSLQKRLGLTGLQVIHQDAAGVAPLLPRGRGSVVLAGLGGRPIRTILEALYPDGPGRHRLILSPHRHPDRLAGWLLDQGWPVTEEPPLMEKSASYRIFVVDGLRQPGDGPADGCESW